MNQCFLYEGFLDNFQKELQKDYFRKTALSYQTLADAYALPPKTVWQDGLRIRWGGIVDSNLQYIKDSGRFRNEEHSLVKGVMLGAYEFKKDSCPTISEEVIYCGEYMDHWGHFLLESTTRLWYAVRNKKAHQKLIFVAPKGTKIKGNFKEFFKLLGVSLKDIILITRPTKLKSVIIPQCSSVLCTYYMKEFIEPFEAIRKTVKKEKAKRIYLSRRKCKIRFIVGEDKLEKVFKKNGFTVIYPERLSLKKLISVISDAEYIAGLSGSALHNAVFCSNKPKLIILNRSAAFNDAQALINQAMNLDAIYADANLNYLPSDTLYLIGVTKPFKEMCQSLGFAIDRIPPLTPKEVKSFFNQWLKILPKQYKYLSQDQFEKSAEIAYLLFGSMSSFSLLHQKMDLLKYGILSKISWGSAKKKYLTKLHHYQEKYNIIKE